MKYSIKGKPAYLQIAVFSFMFCVCQIAQAQFTGGNLVVLQASDGISPLVNTGNKIILREFSPQGAAAFSVAIPVSINPLLIGGSASSEGGLSLSANGEYLVFGGYAQSLPNSTPLSGSSASAINRGVGIVDVAGGYTRVATSNSFFTGNNIRSATSDGNNNYWAAGSNNGTNYFGLNSAALTVQNAVANTRCISVVNSSVYVSCGSGTFGICRVGSGLPFAPGQGASLVINTATSGSGSASPYAFYFNSLLTVCYVADDRNPASGGGIQKWLNSAGTWTLAYTLGTGANYGARGVVADFSGQVPRVYATTSEGSSNRLIVINDAGAASSATLLASSGSNAIFRGLAFSPNCSNPQLVSITAGTPACFGQSLAITSSVSALGPLAYGWSGPASFTASSQNVLVSNPLSGHYSLTITNACGNDTASVFVMVHPLPQLFVNQPTVCNGGTAVLTVNGASSYSWNTGSTAPVFTVMPSGTSNFTVVGTSQMGCVNSITTSVQVVNALTLSVTSATICTGYLALLSVSGAANYTWSTGVSTTTLNISPIATQIYSVTGNASGCLNPASATVMVMVNPLPAVSISPVATSLCLDDGPVTLNGLPQGGLYSGQGVNASVFDPSVTLAGTFTVSYTYTDINACSDADTTTIIVDLCTGIGDAENRLVSIYPNPASEKLVIAPNDFSGIYSIEIFQLNGQKINSLNRVHGNLELDLGQYPRGIYLLVWRAGNQSVRIKFIKD